MFRSLVIVAAFMPILVFGLTNPQICRGGAPLPFGIRISGCTTAPCELVLGTKVSMELDFTASTVLSKPNARVFAESLGMTGEYELPASQADVCSNIPQSCPLDEGEDATFSLQMDLDGYPITDFYLEVLIEEAGSNITCFRLPARTTN